MDGILLTKAACEVSPSFWQMMQEMNVPLVLVMRTYRENSKDTVTATTTRGHTKRFVILHGRGANELD